MDVKGIGLEDVDWTQLSQDRDKRRVFSEAGTNHSDFSGFLAAQAGLCFMKSVTEDVTYVYAFCNDVRVLHVDKH
jgi:hypothetical protein